ncbi:MAG TPA: FHA domain-containing protein [Acidimicrobiia bacterium]|jgi:pSer/pThr/pTyr-binding forkhead associated (FHA) protein
MTVCGRCGHTNEERANYCSSCGAPLAANDEDTTLTLAAINAVDETDDLAQFLDDLPDGVGLLVVRTGPTAGSSFRLDADETSVGRHPASDIFLDDITVSRRHVTINRDEAVYTLHDVGSLNGTYVNRERCDAATLQHGDEIQIGRYRLTFVERGDGA